ncbi:MAG: TetR/AcrR family transcriptional regulator [Bacteroidales bacterium]|nr:TetR/AcrR family transcriptional regulator [Bacteroidales bacterium]
MASRTRERLIDVARQLFARKGIENTTMNDIATASDRGRRTIYTYFRTKSEIYQAVIEDESARIIKELSQTIESRITPGDKLRALMEYRIKFVVDSPSSGDVWLKSFFSRDAKRANSVRTMTAERIYDMIDKIVAAGVASGDFDPVQAQRLPSMLAMIIRGSDLALMRDSERELAEQWREQCINFIIDAVENKKS